MVTKKEVDAKFVEASEHLFHVANILGSGYEDTQLDFKLRRSMARDMALGLAKLGQANQLQFDYIESELSHLRSELRSKR